MKKINNWMKICLILLVLLSQVAKQNEGIILEISNNFFQIIKE